MPEGYAGAPTETLDALRPEQRHHLYKMSRIEVLAHADGTTEIVLGDLLSYDEVCTDRTLSRRRALGTNLRTMVRVVLEQDGTRRMELTRH